MGAGRETPGHGNWIGRLGTGAVFAVAILVGLTAFLVLWSGLQHFGPKGGLVASSTSTPTVVAARTPRSSGTPTAEVASVLPTPTPGFTYKISAGQRINLRSQPTTSADVVTTLAPGTPVMIVGPDKSAEGKTWKNIKDQQGNTGWTWSDFVVFATSP